MAESKEVKRPSESETVQQPASFDKANELFEAGKPYIFSYKNGGDFEKGVHTMRQILELPRLNGKAFIIEKLLETAKTSKTRGEVYAYSCLKILKLIPTPDKPDFFVGLAYPDQIFTLLEEALDYYSREELRILPDLLPPVCFTFVGECNPGYLLGVLSLIDIKKKVQNEGAPFNPIIFFCLEKYFGDFSTHFNQFISEGLLKVQTIESYVNSTVAPITLKNSMCRIISLHLLAAPFTRKNAVHLKDGFNYYVLATHLDGVYVFDTNVFFLINKALPHQQIFKAVTVNANFELGHKNPGLDIFAMYGYSHKDIETVFETFFSFTSDDFERHGSDAEKWDEFGKVPIVGVRKDFWFAENKGFIVIVNDKDLHIAKLYQRTHIREARRKPTSDPVTYAIDSRLDQIYIDLFTKYFGQPKGIPIPTPSAGSAGRGIGAEASGSSGSSPPLKHSLSLSSTDQNHSRFFGEAKRAKSDNTIAKETYQKLTGLDVVISSNFGRVK